jgi:hypothetical protein
MQNESIVAPNQGKRVYRSEDQWRDLVNGYDRSGLPLAAYCQQQGIAVSGFYAWRKRVASVAEDQSAFIELTPPRDHRVEAVLPERAWRIEVVLGEGVVLRLR